MTVGFRHRMRLIGTHFSDGTISHDEARRQLVSLVAEQFRSSRVAYWALDGEAGQRTATCIVSGGVPAALHTPGAQLFEPDMPDYFRTLSHMRVYACHDTALDSALSPFKSRSLEAGMPSALLHAACAANGKLIGVLCIEQVGGPRRWSRPEMMAAMRIATALSMFIARFEARHAVLKT